MTDAQAAERSKWLALALLAATQFVIVLDAAIVNVAIPSIGRDLHFSEENLTWIPNAYAGAARDVLDLALQAALAERRGGGRQDLLPVAARVRAERAVSDG